MTHRNLMQYFGYDHLPERLWDVSKPFHDIASALIIQLPDNPQRTRCLEKLLEAKDCAVRAAIYKAPGDETKTKN